MKTSDPYPHPLQAPGPESIYEPSRELWKKDSQVIGQIRIDSADERLLGKTAIQTENHFPHQK